MEEKNKILLKRLLIAVLIIVIISIVATIGIGNYFVNYAILRTGNVKIAATLHDCGKFVSITRGSESSYQIIMDTEIIGISHLEREVVANIVRYNIQEYAYDEVILESDLSQYAGLGTSRRELTILIAKLTAILRLANSMDRSHRQKLSDSRIAVRNGSLVITTDCPESIVLEQYSFDQKADFFEEVFGIRPVLRQKRGV